MNTSSMHRRNFLQLAAATVSATAFGGAFAACGGASPSSSGGTVTLSYWDYYVSQAPWVDNEIKLFQQAHPKIQIKKTTQVSANYANLFALAASSKRLPDVALIPSSPSMAQQVSSGWWQPVDKWATSTWQGQFPAGTFHQGNNMFGGKIYSAPNTTAGAALQLYINNSVFKQAGLTNADGSIQVPLSWDDVTHAAEAIVKKSGGSIYGLGFGNSTTALLPAWMQVFTQGGGSPCTPSFPDYRTGQWTFGTDRNYQDFLQLLLEWKQKGYIYPNSISALDEAARALFAQGKLGMTVGGVWNQAEWTMSNFTDYTLVGLVPPSQSLQRYYYAVHGGVRFGIPAQTKYPDEAWAWFDWLYSPAAGKRWVEMGEGLSVFSQNNDPTLVKLKPFAQFVATTKLVLPGPDPTVRNPQVSQVKVATVAQDLNATMAGIYTGHIQDIQSALSETAGLYQKALSDGIAQAVQQGAKVSINDYIFPDWDPTQPYVTKPAS
jgi:ABC-type sugar transport system, periplasmic component